MSDDDQVLEEESIDINLFDVLLHNLCHKFGCPVNVLVQKSTVDESYLINLKLDEKSRYTKKSSLFLATSDTDVKSDELLSDVKSSVIEYLALDDDKIVNVKAIYDLEDDLVEISFVNISELPIEPVQVLATITPFYKKLTKLTIIRTNINGYIIDELRKMIPLTTITEVCFKDLNFKEANYAILLDSPAKLKSLTISNCSINDKVCQQIASKMHYLSTEASQTLVALNLSLNHITDIGANYLAQALRTNRSIRYLNLANNRITDKGAIFILKVLTKFSLTSEEVIEKRRRKFQRLAHLHELYQSYLKQVITDLNEFKGSSKRKNIKTDDAEFIKNQAERLAKEEIGVDDHPFADEHLNYTDCIYCNGNLSLCYLNLAFNDLSFLSIKKLKSVLNYQSRRVSDPNNNYIGLLQVVIYGNNVSLMSPEWRTIRYFLNCRLVSSNKKRLPTQRKTNA